MPPSKNRDRREEWQDWRSKADFFARGAFARVYHKRQSAYPPGYFRRRGTLVKVLRLNDGHVANPRQFFFEARIIHALFPKNSLHIRAVRFDREANALEIHCDEVPVHDTLRDLQEQRSKVRPLTTIATVDTRSDNFRFVRARQAYLKPVINEMDRAGVEPHFENFENVSLADLRHPVFFEAEIFDPELTRQYIENTPMAESTRQELRQWLARYNALEEK